MSTGVVDAVLNLGPRRRRMSELETLISIDPGMSTGIVVGTYSSTDPFKILHSCQISGGVEGFLRAVSVYKGEDWNLNDYLVLYLPNNQRVEIYRYCPELECDECDNQRATVLVEKFTARGGANQSFSYRTDALEPLRVEGAILALDLAPEWVDPRQQYFIGGKDKAEKKKRQHAWLKENGYYIAPKDVGSPDADDVRSATAHAISWLRRQKHEPTLEMFR